MSDTPVMLVCMGVAGSGKSTLAGLIAEQCGLVAVDADDEHPAGNRAKMAAGIPLDDEDRVPWMDAVCRRVTALKDDGRGCVLAHSGLRKRDRARLRRLGFRTLFLHLDADPKLLARRLASRDDHFFGPSLLQSQLDALQPARREPNVHRVDVSESPERVMHELRPLIDRFLSPEVSP